MALKFNPATGKTEDDGADAGQATVTDTAGMPPPDLSAVEPVPVGDPNDRLARPIALPGDAPAAPAPTPTAVPPPPAAAPPPSPEVEAPAVPEIKTVTKTPEVTRHLTNPEELKADKGVAAATEQGAKALELEAKNRLKQAEIDQSKLDIEHQLEKQRAENAAKADAEAQRRKADLDAQAKRDQDSYQAAAAAGDKGFWGDPSVPTKNQWALSLMFGNIAEAFGAKNVGRELLDKNMAQWTAERDKKLARLERQADKSSGLQRSFWQDYGPEYKMRKELQDAAAYTTVADQWEAVLNKQKGLLSAQAIAVNAKGIADYRQKAAEKRQAVVDARFGRDQVKSGGAETTTVTGKPAPNSEGRAQADARMRATLAEKGREALSTIDQLTAKGVKLTEKDRIRIQENRKEIEKDKHTGYVEGKLGRLMGGYARSQYEGLSDDQKLLAQSLETVQQSWAGLASPSHAAEEVEHTRGLMDFTSPGSDATYESNLRRARGMIGGQGAMAGAADKTIRKGAAAGQAAAPAAPGGVRQTRRLKSGQTVSGTLMADGSFQVD